MRTRRGRLLIAMLLMVIVAISSSNVFAVTNITTTFDKQSKYIVILNNETVQIPVEQVFDNGVSLDLSPLHERLSSMSGINFRGGAISISGFLYTGLNGDFAGLLDTKGNYKPLTIDQTRRNFYTNALTTSRKNRIAEFERSGTTQPRELALLKNYKEDIELYAKINTSDIPKTNSVIGIIPYIYQNFPIQSSVDSTKQEVDETIRVSYYLYGIVHRDLRLNQIAYSVNNGSNVAIKDFNSDTREYKVVLPCTTPRNATIKTTSTVKYSSIYTKDGYTLADLDMTLTEGNVKLNDGKGTAKVKITFDPSNFPNDRYTDVVTQYYTVNFETAPYEKGDINMDGAVNVEDAALVLDNYKGIQTVTNEQFVLGDMDDNNVLNVEDAGLILNKYKGVL